MYFLTVFYINDSSLFNTKARTLQAFSEYTAVAEFGRAWPENEIFEEMGNNPFDEERWFTLSERFKLRSMSVGDFIYDELQRKVILCEAIGWSVFYLPADEDAPEVPTEANFRVY